MSPTTTFNVANSSDDWRGVALSNFMLSPFMLDGKLFASIEGFIQGIKFPEQDPRRQQAFESAGWDAKNLSALADGSGAYWNGSKLAYGSKQHHDLIAEAIRARIVQNTGLAQALVSTGNATIIHETGQPESPTTSLPAEVFCRILTEVRDQLRSGEQ